MQPATKCTLVTVPRSMFIPQKSQLSTRPQMVWKMTSDGTKERTVNVEREKEASNGGETSGRGGEMRQTAGQPGKH